MNFEFFIGARYFLTLQKERFISVISLIAATGVAIGVMALIVVLAVMTGFDNDLKDKIIGANPHIVLAGEEGIPDFNAISQKAGSLKDVKKIAPYVSGQAFLYHKDKVLSLNLKGVDPVTESDVTRIKDYIAGGKVDLPKGGIILGKELTHVLGVEVGDEVVLSSPVIGLNTTFKVSGIFHTGMYDYDLNLAFLNIRDAQEFFGVGSLVTQAGIRISDPYRVVSVKKELAKILPPTLHIRTWMEINQNFFAALALEKLTMFVILTLIVLVACFNIISSLIVMVVEKTKDIGILKAIGAPEPLIRRVFTWGGLIVGLGGTFFGIIGGVALCFLLKKYQFIQLPRDIYYIDRLPVALRWQDIALIAGSALLITFLSTIYPSRKAAQLNPVDALRYE
ncbi:MAG TPA: lipoprotein-releasing system transmembrane subunit LolC [Candidatus Omnitrophica bacterium]|nr:lipoprotein-releasing system transmembrane subunit LolC [Candidatus Omnitrophota bacterium]